jgi:hypothetical protein
MTPNRKQDVLDVLAFNWKAAFAKLFEEKK